MFFVDKYSLVVDDKTGRSHSFHEDSLEKLKVMSQDESITHLIFYGPQGCGKKTVIQAFLEMVYNKEIHKTDKILYNVVGSGNTSHEVEVEQSNYHIVIEPNNNNFDRYLVQDVVNDYAKRAPLNMFTSKKSFKTVLINNIDSMSYYAQTSLRRTMEKYSDTCRFIMWSRSLSKVIDPLRSRCYCFKIEAPKDDDMLEMLLKVSATENIKLGLLDYRKILDKSDSNIKKALWLLQLKQLGESTTTVYDKILDLIVIKLLTFDLKNLLVIRELLYKIMITNINGTNIISDITKRLVTHKEVSFQSKLNLAEIAAKYEHNLIRGRREIMHLEAYATEVMRLLFNESAGKDISKKRVICL